MGGGGGCTPVSFVFFGPGEPVNEIKFLWSTSNDRLNSFIWLMFGSRRRSTSPAPVLIVVDVSTYSMTSTFKPLRSKFGGDTGVSIID